MAACVGALGQMTISPTTLPNGFVGTPYPTTGIISGTPTAVGSSTFTVTATLGTAPNVVITLVQVFTVGINALTITGLPSVAPPGTQSSATVSLAGGANVDTFTGTLTLTFVPASGS